MAITTSYTWNITELRNDTSDKFITHASFSITGVAKSDGVAICTVRDTCCTPVNFETERTGSEKPFADVTEADILATQQAWNFDFIGILNHNLHSAQNAVNIWSDGLALEEIALSNIVNWNVGDIPEYNGFSLASIDATPANITDNNCKILGDNLLRKFFTVLFLF